MSNPLFIKTVDSKLYEKAEQALRVRLQLDGLSFRDLAVRQMKKEFHAKHPYPTDANAKEYDEILEVEYGTNAGNLMLDTIKDEYVMSMIRLGQITDED